MKSSNPLLPTGFSQVPPGKIASVVTCLEMREKPVTGTEEFPAGMSCKRWVAPDVEVYRTLFRAIGEEWLWSSRLERSDEALRSTLEDAAVEVYVLSEGSRDIGLLELDFRAEDACEIVFLGLIKDALHKGLGGLLIQYAIAVAWSHPISRLWLHTCHLDHPAALGFYQRFGFKPTSRWVEVFDDPRLTGIFPRHVAPHIPIIEA